MIESIPETSWHVSANDPMALTRLLNLPGMRVTGLEYDLDQDRLHVYCEHTTERAECPSCQRSSYDLHEYTKRAVRDLPMGGKVCLLEFAARRFYCRHCRCPFREDLSWLPRCSRLTQRFREFVFEECRRTSIQAVQQKVRLGYRTIERLYYALAEQMLLSAPAPLVRKLGIDEFAIKKGHDDFALVLTDLEAGSLIAVLPDRKKETLEEYFVECTPQQRAAIEEVTMDLWEGFASTVEDCLPHARIVADRFHVMKMLNDQVSAARRQIHSTLPEESKQALKGCRWLIVRNEAELSQEDKRKLAVMLALCPDLARLHQLKEEFREILEARIDKPTAAQRLTEWVQRVQASGLAKLDKFIKTLLRRWEPILNYFHSRLSNGMVEGLNNKVKVIKRCAYGFGDFQHLALRLRIECDGGP